VHLKSEQYETVTVRIGVPESGYSFAMTVRLHCGSPAPMPLCQSKREF
jgi:hypothetical protein